MTTETDHWYTPDNDRHPVLTLVKRALGGAIGLDPTADPDRRVPATRHYTESDNCLIRTAEGLSIFCNPPFSHPLPFVEWVSEQVRSGHSPQAIMLLKIGTLANQGTGQIIKTHAAATCEWQYNGRIEFEPGQSVRDRFQKEFAAGKRKKPAPSTADFDTVFVYFGSDPTLFLNVFDGYGNTAIRRSFYTHLLAG